MVAAMLRTNENDNAPIGLRTTDLRNIAIGLAAAIALIMVGGQIHDSGSASASALEDTAEKRFAAPIALTTPTSSATEEVAYSSTITWNDADGTDVSLSCSCLSWMTFTDGGGSANTATITGTPQDSNVDAGGTSITVTGTSGGESVSQSYTITVTEVNDEPTLTASAAGGTFTEDGSNVALFSSADAADGDSQTTQTWKVLTFTVTNVADTTESIVVDGSTQALTDGGSTANTATN